MIFFFTIVNFNDSKYNIITLRSQEKLEIEGN